jgi:hypothetical protein
MKVRNGFVSNSSSSSFVAVGWEATDELKEKIFQYYLKKFPNNEDECSIEDIYEVLDKIDQDFYFIDSGKEIIGNYIARTEDDYLEEGEYSLAEFIKIITDSKFADNIGVDINTAKIFTGVESC